MHQLTDEERAAPVARAIERVADAPEATEVCRSAPQAADLFLPLGFTPIRLVRAPYLCAGDSYSPVAALDACIVVLQPPHRAVPIQTSSSSVAAGTPPSGADPTRDGVVCTECAD